MTMQVIALDFSFVWFHALTWGPHTHTVEVNEQTPLSVQSHNLSSILDSGWMPHPRRLQNSVYWGLYPDTSPRTSIKLYPFSECSPIT
ncbi:hypothetical protein BDZ94DRAFT_1254772 [Collybia nuda]|uniref:Secreted protein n=1 Tax=Collybia nuda TaxID=64659 RepID=A0A9P5YAK8_9AGAR|nr:hypothetical protein BDZ94DRAFT_1254772 [Collybia nuda]